MLHGNRRAGERGQPRLKPHPPLEPPPSHKRKHAAMEDSGEMKGAPPGGHQRIEQQTEAPSVGQLIQVAQNRSELPFAAQCAGVPSVVHLWIHPKDEEAGEGGKGSLGKGSLGKGKGKGGDWWQDLPPWQEDRREDHHRDDDSWRRR
eukprot:8215640-Alexandrium_andersonii.AAC.1